MLKRSITAALVKQPPITKHISSIAQDVLRPAVRSAPALGTPASESRAPTSACLDATYTTSTTASDTAATMTPMAYGAPIPLATGSSARVKMPASAVALATDTYDNNDGDSSFNMVPPSKELPFLSQAENERLRRKHLAPSLKAHYDNTSAGPLKLKYGRGQYLYDINNREYLDCVNNVCHVGHCHPRVVAAAHEQLKVLNTNSRYLHDNIVLLAKQLADSMPDPLEVVFFTNSGTEANDLALRLARNYTGKQHMYAVDGAYHGHSEATRAVSNYSKYSQSNADRAVILSSPDSYRRGTTEDETRQVCVDEYKHHLLNEDIQPAGFIVESLICCGGQIVLPDGYLRDMYSLTREHGGITIADEVQTGFGRTGSHMWAFETQGVVPDIVTVGKPAANGTALSATITTREVVHNATNFEYFNTFGGNPVACAVGLEVMSVIEDENLMSNASVVGDHAMKRLVELAEVHPIIGDVRGLGLLFGVELVKDRDTREPHPEAAGFVMQQLKAQGVLVSSDGPHRNILKMKPPMCIRKRDINRLIRELDSVLSQWTELEK